MSTWHSVILGPIPERQMQICSTMQHDGGLDALVGDVTGFCSPWQGGPYECHTVKNALTLTVHPFNLL